MIPTQVAVAVLLSSLVHAVSGVILVRLQHRLCGTLLIMAGATGVIAALSEPLGQPGLGRYSLVVAVMILLPLALASYPRPGIRSPLDVVALAALIGSGGVALLRSSDTAVLGSVGIVTALILVGYIWWRIERGSRAERWALTWMSASVLVAGFIVGVAVFIVPSTTSWAVAVSATGLVGPAMVLGVLRPELVDVRRLVVRSVVFVVAAIAYVAALTSLIAVLEIVVGSPLRIGVVALVAVLVAAGFHPLRILLRGVIDELIFGRRPGPLEAATQMVGNMSEDPQLAVQAIQEGLTVPYAALVLDDGSVVAVAGDRAGTGRCRNLQLCTGHGPGIELEVGLRAEDVALSPADEHALRLVIPLLEQTLRVGVMATQLQASREQTVTALQEERRRVRRDLHDGLGPRLSAIAWTSDAVRNTFRVDPEAAEALLDTLRLEASTAIADIRRLTYAMRPPALDELGLIQALEQAARSLRRKDGQPLRVQIEAQDVPDHLTAAVEVAAYRIVSEALTNVARHSAGHQAQVRLCGDSDRLSIEVEDDGGPSAPWHPGIGLQSMRERAAELGGAFAADSTSTGGHVRASLPLTRAV